MIHHMGFYNVISLFCTVEMNFGVKFYVKFYNDFDEVDPLSPLIVYLLAVRTLHDSKP